VNVVGEGWGEMRREVRLVCDSDTIRYGDGEDAGTHTQ